MWEVATRFHLVGDVLPVVFPVTVTAVDFWDNFWCFYTETSMVEFKASWANADSFDECGSKVVTLVLASSEGTSPYLVFWAPVFDWIVVFAFVITVDVEWVS